MMTEKSLHEDKSETEWKHTVVETKNKGIVIRRGGGGAVYVEDDWKTKEFLFQQK